MKTPVDDGYRILAANYFDKQAKQLGEQLDGVRSAEDIESIHRARVASRRLRAAVELLGDWVPAKQSKRWRKEIRKITKGLGDARDKDVQIDFLCRALSGVEDPACCPGIAHLVMHLEYQREMLQPTVAAAADRLDKSGVLDEMRHEAGRVTSKAARPDAAVPMTAVEAHCSRQIRKCLKELLSQQGCLENAADAEGHHRMRIAAKHLRYTLEISKPLFEDQIGDILAAVKNVQTLLGEIHDCDVWTVHLEAFLEEERRRMAACFGSSRPFARVRIGLEYLQDNRRQARSTIFEELVDYWRALHSQDVWEKLGALVRADAATSQVDPLVPDGAEASGRSGAQKNGNGHHRAEAGHELQSLAPRIVSEVPPQQGRPPHAVGHGGGES